MENTRAQRLTPVELAFIGDAVHTLYVRERLIEASDEMVGTLHVAATKLVNARAQAEVFDSLWARAFFTDEESDVARRAKNAHLHSRTKTATPGDYHKATALEAVIGYAHVCGQAEREQEILSACYAEALGLSAGK